MGEVPAAEPVQLRLSRAEWGLLLVLATINFTHILDFVIVMPLGPALQSAMSLSAARFGWVVSAYGFSASVGAMAAALILDRFDRKKALLVLFTGFALGTILCALAPSFEVLLLGRVLAGGFGGVLGACLMAVVGDVLPYERRGQAMGVLMSAFSMASIVGLPCGLWLANRWGWAAPFMVIGGFCVPVFLAAAWLLPPLRGHLVAGSSHHPKPWTLLSNRGHLRAFALMVSLVMSTFTVVPFLALYLVNNVGLDPDTGLPYVYLFGGIATLLTLTPMGRMADRFGKLLSFRIMATFTLLPTMLLTNLPPVSRSVAVLVTTLFMVSTSCRMVPAMAMITASAAPAIRGSFMSVNTAVQHMAIGLAPLLSSWILGGAEASGESLQGFSLVGLVAMTAMITSVVLAGQVRPASGG